jgi:phosphoribosylaminoimidazolecarboxamide formyltransferase/IMP cyclohydrolase
MSIVPIKRALLSVSDKTHIVAFAQALVRQGIEIISTGGTSQMLREAKVAHQVVEDITGMPEMLDGRVKTLHPKIHGGILGRRDEHAAEALQHQISWIDLVIVNFYPFEEAIKNQKLLFEEAIEYIDIGGPTMVRAAAKNFAWVSVVTDPQDYEHIITELQQEGGLSIVTRRNLAEKAFALTAHYDDKVHQYFVNQRVAVAAEQPVADLIGAVASSAPAQLQLHLEKYTDLRYGENPHQQASAYKLPQQSGLLAAKQHQGKVLSYNNLLDAEAAWHCVNEFTADKAEAACVIVKHANPCGAARAATIEEAYVRAYQADPVSAFGGIIALNRPCTPAIAQQIASIFIEVLLAPGYTDEALAILAAKPNLRVLTMPIEEQPQTPWEMRFITGGILLQERDQQRITINDLQIVTQIRPTAVEMENLLFAWRIVKHIKSNGILLAKDDTTVGIGAGQVSRIDAVDLAIRKAGVNIKDTVLASDAFFPFRDSIDRIANIGIRAIIQPGGSMRDEEVIAACNEHNIAMVFTGKRCFKH